MLEGPQTLCHTRPYDSFRRVGEDYGGSLGLMRGKRGLVLGVANNRSLAWGIARACRAQGAEIAFTYQGDALKKRVEPLAQRSAASCSAIAT